MRTENVAIVDLTNVEKFFLPMLSANSRITLAQLCAKSGLIYLSVSMRNPPIDVELRHQVLLRTDANSMHRIAAVFLKVSRRPCP